MRPTTHLASFKGILHVAGYADFEQLADNEGVLLAACWSHSRRQFNDVAEATGSPLATDTLRQIAELYAVEARIRGQSLLTGLLNAGRSPNQSWTLCISGSTHGSARNGNHAARRQGICRRPKAWDRHRAVVPLGVRRLASERFTLSCHHGVARHVSRGDCFVLLLSTSSERQAGHRS
ncbi:MULTISPECIES: IS66 family transposase [unclassified Bradyrhizobium]|uniref:IS66 family transposase n=1 Tax=unclassified Bradyrhizobium TaxID=2631580 RepID=UPI002916BA7F|nr:MULTISPECIES: transposase [unclassified Bradyrhizobium]